MQGQGAVVLVASDHDGGSNEPDAPSNRVLIMSIPRLAIHRPVTMFMISGVITLLGVISLTRLPVDLMPEFEQPTLNVRTSYPGVGPLEMEELITRPMEQAVSAVPGITRVESSSSEGNSQIRLNFEWGSDLSEAADEVRTRVDRMRNRLPEDADPPTIYKFDSNQLPVAQIAIEGEYDPVTLRDVAQNEIAPRFERVDGVAAVTVNGGVRREIHVDLSKEKITALNLSVSQVVNALRSENQNTPLGEIFQGDSTFLVRSQGQFQSIEDIRNIVVLTREGVPVYLRDLAEVSDTTEQRRTFLRINGRPGIQIQVQKQSGKNTVAVADAVRAEVDRVNREVPGIKMTVTQDNSVFIQRAIHNVQEHALVGGVLVVLIIFAFLRDVLRAALLRWLHAEHDDLRRACPWHRHDRGRGHRRARKHPPSLAYGQGQDDGSHRRQRGSLVRHSRLDADAYRGVRPAAFPVRHGEHHVHATVGGRDVLAGNVALRRRDDRPGALLTLAEDSRRRGAGERRHGALLPIERAIP
jgi:HAE1 family hydrophobic/amphiphilic exporter-1